MGSSRTSKPAWASSPPTKRARHDSPPCIPGEVFRWPHPSDFTCGVPIQAPSTTTNAELISSAASSPANRSASNSDDEKILLSSDGEIESEVKRKTQPDDNLAAIMDRIRAGLTRDSQASAPAMPQRTEVNRLATTQKQPPPEQLAPKPRETRPVGLLAAETFRIDDQAADVPTRGSIGSTTRRGLEQQPRDRISDRVAAASSGGLDKIVHPAGVCSATTTVEPVRAEPAASGCFVRPLADPASDHSVRATTPPDQQPPTDRLAILKARVRAREAGKCLEQAPGTLTEAVPTPNGARNFDRFVAPPKYHGNLGFGKSL